MVREPKGKDDKVHHSPQPEDVTGYDYHSLMRPLERELAQKICEINGRSPPVTDDEREQEISKVAREFCEKERRLREAIRKRELEKEVREAMNRLIPLAPKWENKKAVAEFAKLRPLRLVPVIDLESPPYPQRTGVSGRPKGERAFRSVMPDAERAVVEIKWFLTQVYLRQAKEGEIRKMKNAIRKMAFELAAEQFEIEESELQKYWKSSGGERKGKGWSRRFWPRPKITIKI
jgi:hypothetical protein